MFPRSTAVIAIASGVVLALATVACNTTTKAPAASAETATVTPMAASTPARDAPILQSLPDQPEELGHVHWLRDFDAALAKGKAEDKPVLVLFDEVPGCSTVKRFGKTVLRHPLIVEAIETHFVPVAVYNNVDGPDRQVLESFGEPTWNNPVVRIIDHERSALAPRLSGDYSTAGLASNMVQALDEHQGQVPTWLGALAVEERARRDGTDRAVFAMHCFWVGEAHLGGIDGVIDTRTGFLGGREVVEVTYSPRVVSYEDLVQDARERGVARQVFARSEAQLDVARGIAGKDAILNTKPISPSTKDDKYQIRRKSWARIPMTPAQTSRVNALVGFGRDPLPHLSPRQRAIHAAITRDPDGDWLVLPPAGDFVTAWHEASQRARTVASR